MTSALLILRKLIKILKLHILYCSLNIISLNELINMGRAGRVARMWTLGNAYRILTGRPEWMRPLTGPSDRWDGNIETWLKEDVHWIQKPHVAVRCLSVCLSVCMQFTLYWFCIITYVGLVYLWANTVHIGHGTMPEALTGFQGSAMSIALVKLSRIG